MSMAKSLNYMENIELNQGQNNKNR